MSGSIRGWPWEVVPADGHHYRTDGRVLAVVPVTPTGWLAVGGA